MAQIRDKDNDSFAIGSKISGKSLQEWEKDCIFAASIIEIGYPGKFPAWEQDFIDTTPFLIKESSLCGSFLMSLCVASNECLEELSVF